jgi:hypothetical protein
MFVNRRAAPIRESRERKNRRGRETQRRSFSGCVSKSLRLKVLPCGGGDAQKIRFPNVVGENRAVNLQREPQARKRNFPALWTGGL